MVNEEKAKELIRKLVYKCYDNLGYGEKISGFDIKYKVKGKLMTLSEYQDYCFKKELKKFEIK